MSGKKGGCLHVAEETVAMVTGYSQTDFLACSGGASASVIAFVSKIFAVDASTLPANQPRYVGTSFVSLSNGGSSLLQ